MNKVNMFAFTKFVENSKRAVKGKCSQGFCAKNFASSIPYQSVAVAIQACLQKTARIRHAVQKMWKAVVSICG